MAIRNLSTTEAKNRFSAVINAVADDDETVVVEQHGRPKAAIISMEDFAGLQKWKDQQRRERALTELAALRARVRARNLDLTEEHAYQLADRFVRETIDEMIAKGTLHYEGEGKVGAARRSRHERADQSFALKEH